MHIDSAVDCVVHFHDCGTASTASNVARYVSECMQLRETKPDLRRHFEDYHVDLFSSDGDAG